MADQYWIVGADGREYGPVPIETLTLWIRQRRVVARTPVRRNDGPWTEAGQMPDLAGPLGSPAPRPAVPPYAVPPDPGAWDLIGRAWDLVKPYWLVFGAMFFIQAAIASFAQIGFCVHFLIAGAILVGIWRAILGVVAGRAPTVGMMFEGFDRFGEAFLAYLVTHILVALGLVFFIVPGIILIIMWSFTFPILAETRLGFWEAMRQSAILTEGHRWRLFLLGLANVLILILGVLCLCVGVFVAIAVCYTSFALAFRDLQQKKGLIPPAPSAAPSAAPAS